MYLFLLALTLNIDSISIGVGYGIQKIKIPLPALIIIILMCIGSVGLSWMLGSVIFSFISIYFAKLISSILLIILGFTLFIQAKLNIHYRYAEENITIKRFRIKPLNIIINIVREPLSGDIDKSGTIDIKEALYIGAALSLDAITIGLSLVAYEINIIYFLIISSIINAVFIVLGQLVGKYIGKLISENKLKLISSAVIIILGLTKLVL